MMMSYLRVDEKGQLYIDFDALEQFTAVQSENVRQHINVIQHSDRYTFDGLFVDRVRRAVVIVCSSIAANTGDIMQDYVVIPFGAKDFHEYSVIPADLYYELEGSQ
jgi:hypothetical protein